MKISTNSHVTEMHITLDRLLQYHFNTILQDGIK